MPYRPLLLLVIGCALAALACSGGNRGGPDDGGTPPPDAPTDGSPPDAATDGGTSGTEARVQVRDPAGGPVEGVDVVFHDETGAVLEVATSDADGLATAEVPSGGGVTVLWLEATPWAQPDVRASTVLGVDPGDEIHAVVRPFVAEGPTGQMTLSFTGAGGLSGGDWNVSTSCRSETTLGEKRFTYGGCNDSTTFDVYVHLSPWDEMVVFPAESYSRGDTRSYEIDPADAVPAPSIDVRAELPEDAVSYGATFRTARPGGGINEVYRSTRSDRSSWPELSLPQAYVPDGGRATVTVWATLGDDHAGWEVPLDTVPGELTWTLGGLAPVRTIAPLAGTEARPEISWQLGEGDLGDAVRARLRWDTPSPLDETRTATALWTVTAPAAREGAVRFPDLPSELQTWVPSRPYDSVRVETYDAASGEDVLAAFNAEGARVERAIRRRAESPSSSDI